MDNCRLRGPNRRTDCLERAIEKAGMQDELSALRPEMLRNLHARQRACRTCTDVLDHTKGGTVVQPVTSAHLIVSRTSDPRTAAFLDLRYGEARIPASS